MTELFWVTVTGFTLLPLLAVVTRKRHHQPLIWRAVALLLSLQVALGLSVAISGDPLPLGSMAGWLGLGRWDFILNSLAGWIMAILGFIGLVTSFYTSRLNGSIPGSGRLMAAIMSVQYVFTSFLLVSQNAIPFLIAWEGMSLCAYAYILTDHHSRKARHAAYITLTVSELGFLAVVLAFIIAAPSGALNMVAIQQVLARDPAWYQAAVFLLGFFGFGVKSGVLPVQLWMPRAYQVTPFHLNSILGGGLLNLGLFGIIEFYSLMDKLSAGIGIFLIFIGAVAVFAGALYALTETKIRMILAFSSIENVGFMLVSLGLAITFAATRLPYFAGVALVALLFQLTSHALAKALAFLTAGEIFRRTGIDDIDELGGLARELKGVAAAFLVASLTLAAVAPFSGFTAEWLTLQSMLQAYRGLAPLGEFIVVLSGIMVALGAAMSLSAFLRLFAQVFTGKLRKPHFDVTWTLNKLEFAGSCGLLLLAVAVASIGFYPVPILSVLSAIAGSLPPKQLVFTQMVPNVFGNPAANGTLLKLGGGWFSFLPAPGLVVQPIAGISSIAPTYVLWWFIFFSVLGLVLSILMRVRENPLSTRTVGAWNGGKPLKSPGHQYTATAFANPHRMFFAAFLHFQVNRKILEGSELAPASIRVETSVKPWLQSALYAKPIRFMRTWVGGITRLQHGNLWGYVFTVLIAVLLLLLSVKIM